ncbi:TrfB-related DNA-binding protein [Nocardioides terrisoli]|uniref:TrfB-related DNA-binding protein n=1 Tax=Nocardioides terrisoli TaxID=3388267 RepID=UPI00287B771E|nr:TrfB-related DNA-binding protein [Nocardioides marmorisolisilvae]
MTPKPVAEEDRQKFERLRDLRSSALAHARLARQLAEQRRDLISELVEAGYSQADVARELGVTRQAIQKMLAAV